MSIVAEWSYLPSTLLDIITDPWTLLILLGGVILGYIIGVIPGLGPTMGMALVLGIIYKMETNHALALLLGILVAAARKRLATRSTPPSLPASRL